MKQPIWASGTMRTDGGGMAPDKEVGGGQTPPSSAKKKPERIQPSSLYCKLGVSSHESCGKCLFLAVCLQFSKPRLLTNRLLKKNLPADA